MDTFNFACDTNNVREEAAMLTLPHYVEQMFAIVLNSYMCAEHRTIPLATSVRDEETCHGHYWDFIRNRLLSVEEAAGDQAAAEYDSTILRYMQLINLTSQQFADDLIASPWKVADIFHKSVLKYSSIDAVDGSVRHSLRDYWAFYTQADLTDVAFQVYYLLAVQKGSSDAKTDAEGYNRAKSLQKTSWIHALATNVNTEISAF